MASAVGRFHRRAPAAGPDVWPRRLAAREADALIAQRPQDLLAGAQGPKALKALNDQAERVLDAAVRILDSSPVGQAQQPSGEVLLITAPLHL